MTDEGERPDGIKLVPTLAVVAGLWWGQVVIIPLVLSILISYALEPFVSRLTSMHMPRSLAVPVLLVFLLGVTGLGIHSLHSEAELFIEQLPEVTHTIRRIFQPEHAQQSGAVAKVQKAAQELESAARGRWGRTARPPG